MHIFMSHCSFPALKILLKNYLGFEEGDLDEEIAKEFEEVLDNAGMTPADVSEALIKNRRDKGKAVRELLEVLKGKAEKNKKSNVGSAEEEEEEQEKRALESPKVEGCDFEEEDSSCKKGGDEDQKQGDEEIEK